ERDMLLISVEELHSPKFLIAEKVLLSGAATGESVPLHVVGYADVLGERIIESGMSGCSGDDRREVRREFFRRCPLIESRVRTTPHRSLAVAVRLLCKPLDQVVSVPWIIYKRLEFAARISAAANIDERECIAMRCEVSPAGVVAIGNIGSKSEDDWRLW